MGYTTFTVKIHKWHYLNKHNTGNVAIIWIKPTTKHLCVGGKKMMMHDADDDEMTNAIPGCETK